MLNNNLIAEINPIAPFKQIIKGDNYRITVLTAQLIRVEINSEGIFTDSATQSVWNRTFSNPVYTLKEETKEIIITTDKVIFYFNKKSKKVTHIQFIGTDKKVKCSNKYNLKGTARTLDATFGPIPLKNGILSKNGVAIMDDSTSLILDTDGMVKERKESSDLYVFAYNREYLNCLKDFFKLCGKIPLIPRYVLGNWWSRYRAYTQQEYIDLMQRFINSDIPITVATVDMDWHWVQVNKKFGTNYKGKWGGEGWTGYSWDTDLFPDYKGFLSWLKSKDFKITLNLHPADGVRTYEDMYKEMAYEMGIDPNSEQTIEFDITDPKFINAYFKVLHHPYEEQGVDFWWIDWQQGKKSKFKNLDPLWSLNHYHYLDNGRNKRPLILSRYAGVGSHRYPLGFSGDTAMNWRVFNFQPYFTATASNIGYSWWSHDIGGHHLGKKDDELYLRWVQFGIFSPILRLHSTSNDLLGKEPWNYRKDIEQFTIEQLRLRHRLIPYIYTMNYMSHNDDLPLIQPMYYAFPYREEAYNVPNQYYFGTELIVAPITRKNSKKLNMGYSNVWLPEGRWTDIFNGNVYSGGKTVKMFRGLESIPVLAKEGAIIPLSNNKGNDWRNPADMTLLVYRGNNTFSLYEDNGADNGYISGEYAITKYSVNEQEKLSFIINPADGDVKVIPSKRNYRIKFKDIVNSEIVKVMINGKESKYSATTTDYLTVDICNVKPSDKVEIELISYKTLSNPTLKENAVKFLTRYQGSNIRKMIQYRKLKKCASDEQYLYKLWKLSVPKEVKEAITELE